MDVPFERTEAPKRHLSAKSPLIRHLQDSSVWKETKNYKQRMATTVHPNLAVDYFRAINTKEKAYWLGFLYSDGCISRHRTSIQIQIELGHQDEDEVRRFCDCLGLEKSKIKHRIGETGTEYVGLYFLCKEMGFDLLKHGLKFHKSKIIEYPRSLGTRQLELAFLLGYFDGDGMEHTTKITSGSKRFLQQAKNRFEIPYKILKEKGGGEICGRRIRGTRYRMYLGAELFNEMMENYPSSMPRKRWLPCDSKERQRRSAEALTSEMIRKRKALQGSWRAITKAELRKMVWEMPSAYIAAKYHIHPSSVTEKCRKYRIPKPKRGYWARRRSAESKAKQSL